MALKNERKHLAPKADIETINTIIRLYQDGLSSNEIGEILNRDGRGIRKQLERRGLTRSRDEAVRLCVIKGGKIRAEGKKADDRFFDRMTPTSAWILGLIAGDGHIRNDKPTHQHYVELLGTEQVCRSVSEHLGCPRSLFHRRCDIEKLWRVKWSSWYMVRRLRKLLGLKGRSSKKSRTWQLPELPNELMWDFLRGLWDADGCWEKGRARTKLTANNQRILTGIQKLIGGRMDFRLLSVPGRERWYSQGVLELRVGETQKFFNRIYPATSDTRCERKYGQAKAQQKGRDNRSQ